MSSNFSAHQFQQHPHVQHPQQQHPQTSRSLEFENQERKRFLVELEFVQCLANPQYLYYLASQGYFKRDEFKNYLKYLLYWKQPDYIKFIKFPQCLYFLDLLQQEELHELINNIDCLKLIIEQQELDYKRNAADLDSSEADDTDNVVTAAAQKQPQVLSQPVVDLVNDKLAAATLNVTPISQSKPSSQSQPVTNIQPVNNSQPTQPQAKLSKQPVNSMQPQSSKSKTSSKGESLKGFVTNVSLSNSSSLLNKKMAIPNASTAATLNQK